MFLSDFNLFFMFSDQNKNPSEENIERPSATCSEVAATLFWGQCAFTGHTA